MIKKLFPFFPSLYPAIFLLPILLLTLYFYWPGLSSSFYLDDVPNLKNLEQITTDNNALAFIFDNGNMRPLSYLSFVPQHAAWISGNPFPFKLTNLLIHIFNCCLVFIFSLQITKKLQLDIRQSHLTAFITTLLWAIAPIHINSVLYTIQRMTLLSGTFTLLAAITFLKIESCYTSYKQWLGSAFLIGLLFILGISCKENAILISVYIAVLMACLTGFRTTPKWWIFLVIFLPLAATTAYIFLSHQINFTGRNFSLTQRLITEPQILFDYFRKIIFPLPNDISLFYENYPFFKQLNTTAFFYIAALITTFLLACVSRKKYPVASFAILWFLGGHLLESSIIPLELYFEHRNYLPCIGIFFAVAFYTATGRQFKPGLYILCVALFINACFTTYIEIDTWSSKKKFAIAAVLDHPESTRALQLAAEYYLSQGDVLKAAKLIHHSHTAIKPYSTHLIYLLGLKCLDDRLLLPPLIQLNKEIEQTGYDLYLEDAVHSLFDVLANNKCKFISWKDYETLMDTIIKISPGNNDNFFIMHHIFAQQMGGDKTAILEKVRAIDVNRGSIDQGFFKVYMLLENEQYTEAASTLQLIENRFQRSKRIYIYRTEFSQLKQLIKNAHSSQ